jgi:hypothetical protein
MTGLWQEGIKMEYGYKFERHTLFNKIILISRRTLEVGTTLDRFKIRYRIFNNHKYYRKYLFG